MSCKFLVGFCILTCLNYVQLPPEINECINGLDDIILRCDRSAIQMDLSDITKLIRNDSKTAIVIQKEHKNCCFIGDFAQLPSESKCKSKKKSDWGKEA